MPDEWIRQWGDPTLRQVASPVTAVDEILHRQVTRMMRRLEESAGAGLAATQVGVMRRVFVFRLSGELDVDVLVNPRIVSRSAERVIFHEGCLSFNAVTVAVERPAAVRVEGQDLAGHPRAFEVEAFGASLVQHEIDHLDGILTLDRAAAEERRRAIRILLAPAATDHGRAA
jgi:peptide deformylase